MSESIPNMLSQRSADPWLSGIERPLIDYAEAEMLQPHGLMLQSYGTGRFLERNPLAPREVIFQLLREDGPGLVVENLLPPAFDKYQQIGLVQRRWGLDNDVEVIETLCNAIRYFDSSPSLQEIVGILVRSVHVLAVDGDSFDLSYSDPEVPLSVFVSVPAPEVPHGSLRVCESLLHECMHLQLALVERRVSLVRHNKAVLYSPWQSELRPPSGVLHGIHVFRAVLQFFRRLEQIVFDSSDLEYIRRRQSEISTELTEARRSLRVFDLTPEGRSVLAISVN